MLYAARDRKTSVDEIFEYLYNEISNMRLRPGDKLSEAAIAAKFGVSRQPVRDAFSRLEHLDLLLIRPQRATEVKRFSSREITKSRFVRAAVEAEVLRRAALYCDSVGVRLLNTSLEQQREVAGQDEFHLFGLLDYEFHKALCTIAKVEFAYEVIAAEKVKVDRLCLLGLSEEHRMPQLLADHEEIARAVKNGDGERAVAAGMVHLSRLDATIDAIATTSADYFEPDPET